MESMKAKIVRLVEEQCNSGDNPHCLVYVARSQQGTLRNPRPDELTADLASGSFSSADLRLVLPPRDGRRVRNEAVRSFRQTGNVSPSVLGHGGIAHTCERHRRFRKRI